MSAPLQVVEDRQAVQITKGGEPPKYPVQSQNVLTHLHESLADEHAAVRAKEQALSADLDELRQYRATLEAVARAAGIALP